ncbi:hypothetical protein F5Y12DRAFT_800852 [Xylaria sp. FL1777]|nr:hypothetical protein F5Y12DRAFT_800852 [Xylaria sp. FL1777]
MAELNTLSTKSACSSAFLNPPKMALIPYESACPRLREVYELNKSSFLHGIPPEIRNTIMEYSVTLEENVEPLPIACGVITMSNKFVWGEYKIRRGTLGGQEIILRFPTSRLAVVSLRQTCRQFYHELEGVFYRVNTFSFSNAKQCKQYLSALTVARRHQIRNIYIEFTGVDHLPWTMAADFSMRFLTLEKQPLSQLLLANCPSLRRLVVCMGNRPVRSELLLCHSANNAYNSFKYELGDLHWKQGDRNPDRVFKQMNRRVHTIEYIIKAALTMETPLSHPRLEFFISGSPTMFARVNGHTVRRSSSDAPSYKREFESTLEKVNMMMQDFYGLWPKSYTEELSSHNERYREFLLGEITQVDQRPIPDLADFKEFDLERRDVPIGTHVGDRPNIREEPAKYDENGILAWDNLGHSYLINIVWKEGEILIAMSYDRQIFGECFVFEPVSRFATWDGVYNIFSYISRIYEPSTYPLHNIRKVVQVIEHPSPRDIDAALLATGLLNYDDAPTHPVNILRAWKALISLHDYLAEEFAKVMKEASR